MLCGADIKLVTPNADFSTSFLCASKEFCGKIKPKKDFIVTQISDLKRLAFFAGILEFSREVLPNCICPYEKDRISFIYWIIKNNKYIGEIHVLDKPMKGSPIEKMGVPQVAWNEYYKDKIKRYTKVKILLKPSARNNNDLREIAFAMLIKLKELDFTEFALNCNSNNKFLNEKIMQLCSMCGGKYFCRDNTTEYVINVMPHLFFEGINDIELNAFIDKELSFMDFLKGLKERVISTENYKNQYNPDYNKAKVESFLNETYL